MTKPWTCTQVGEASAELALGLLAGNERGAALDHLEHCDRCREAVTANASVIDRLLVAGPRAEPPAGFESRVLEAIDAARPEPPRHATSAPGGPRARHGCRGRRRPVDGWHRSVRQLRWQLTHTGRRHDRADGKTVGKVEMGRSPSTVLVALPGWYEPEGVETSYRMTIATRAGKTVMVDPLRLDESGTWSGALSVDPSTVTGVSVTDATGRPLCHATLTRS